MKSLNTRDLFESIISKRILNYFSSQLSKMLSTSDMTTYLYPTNIYLFKVTIETVEKGVKYVQS